MNQTSDCCSSKLVITKNDSPFSKLDVCGCDQASSLVVIRDGPERQACSRNIERK